MAGLGEACSHIACLLLHLESLEEVSVSEKKYKWNAPSEKRLNSIISPKKLSEINFHTPKVEGTLTEILAPKYPTTTVRNKDKLLQFLSKDRHVERSAVSLVSRKHHQ